MKIKTLGDVIRIFREKKGYTQQYLAHLLDYPQPNISDIEHNKREGATPETIKRIADTLELDYDMLMVMKGEMTGKVKDEMTARAIDYFKEEHETRDDPKEYL